jgi:SAM-dependent methyltransferase
MKNQIDINDLLWKNISDLPYYRGFLRSVEGNFYLKETFSNPILDLGCGDGHFSATTFPNDHIQGIDPSFKSLIEAKSYQFYSGLFCAGGDFLPFENKYFGTVLSNSVLEHIPDVDAVIKEAVRVLKPGGKFIITVPNSNFTKNLSIALFFEKFGINLIADNYRKFFNKISRHYHPDPSEKWSDRISNAGLEIKRQWNYFPPESLLILERGHYLGLPSLINKKIFGKWILFPDERNFLLRSIYQKLSPSYQGKQIQSNGAYTFIVAEKQ